MSSVTVVVLLTLLLGIQPITTDLYLPALPTVQHELGASIGAAQFTLSALIICFGLSQLVCGPLSDRYGRRPVLLTGLALYTAASLLAAAAASIETLIAWRSLQGVAMAAAVTCGRSIVRDLYEPGEGARVMSRALGGLGYIAALSPLAGGLLVEHFDWHAALLALAEFGALTLGYIGWRFDETVPVRNPDAMRLRTLMRNWTEVVANPTFRAWAALSACTFGGLFFMLAGSSFVFINVLGVSRPVYGAILGSVSVAYIGGTLLCRRLLLRHGQPQLYYQFISNVMHEGLQGVITPFPISSTAGAAVLQRAPLRPDLVYIDAGHEYRDVMRDIELYWALLRPGGVLLGDDFVPLWHGVIRAASEFADRSGVVLQAWGEKWLMQKQV